MTTKELEDRLIEFAVAIIKLENILVKSKPSSYLYRPLLRRGTSCPLNYGEAQGAESRKDFIHKLKIISKELRESQINLNIIKKAELSKNSAILSEVQIETSSLLSIFVSSIKTAGKNIVQSGNMKYQKE